jgi:hypothetical protein
MKTVYLYVSMSNNVDEDYTIRYDMVCKNSYQVSLKKKNENPELKTFTYLSDLLQHFEYTLNLLSIDNNYVSLDFIVNSYPTVSIKKHMLKDEETINVFRNVISFEFS